MLILYIFDNLKLNKFLKYYCNFYRSLSWLDIHTREEQAFEYLMVLWTQWWIKIFYIIFKIILFVEEGFQTYIACIRYICTRMIYTCSNAFYYYQHHFFDNELEFATKYYKLAFIWHWAKELLTLAQCHIFGKHWTIEANIISTFGQYQKMIHNIRPTLHKRIGLILDRWAKLHLTNVQVICQHDPT